MPQNPLKSTHYIELGSYQYWPVLVPRGIRLYTFEQIPVFLKENPYITDGYRAHLPSKLCLKSIFILSNETVNIWSHLLGFLLFFSLGVYDMATVLPSLVLLSSLGEDVSPLACSGLRWNIRGDFGMLCAWSLLCLLLLTVLALILAVFAAQIHPLYLTQHWKKLRSVMFCSVAGYGIIPACHWVWLNGGFDYSCLFSVLTGQLNYLGASHQLWHVLVVVMFYWWHQTAVSVCTVEFQREN